MRNLAIFVVSTQVKVCDWQKEITKLYRLNETGEILFRVNSLIIMINKTIIYYSRALKSIPLVIDKLLFDRNLLELDLCLEKILLCNHTLKKYKLVSTLNNFQQQLTYT